LIEQLQLIDHVVQFNQFIADENVKYYFSASDLLVQPYLHATQSGVSQIAFQMNKPMIVTNVGGLPEMVKNGESGFIVEPDAQQLADSIMAFYQSNLEQKFIENTKNEKQKYSWNSFVKAIEKLM